jgi:hypothetical protein
MWLFELEIEMLIVLSKGNIDKNKFDKVVLWKTMFCNIIDSKLQQAILAWCNKIRELFPSKSPTGNFGMV